MKRSLRRTTWSWYSGTAVPPLRPGWLRINSLYVWHASCAPRLQELVAGIVKLDVDEFIARRELGEIPVGTIR